MNNIQINGQRRWGPPENWSGPPPVHGTEIFIKNLPKEVFELELYAIFSSAGEIYEVRLPVNWNGLNRGYAFLRFTSVSAADRAIDRFDNLEIRKHRKIKVARSIDNTRLFLSAVPVEKNAEDLKNDLLRYVENIQKVYVYPTLENRSVFRGYAFVEFETHRDAAIAKRILTPDVCYGIFNKKCVAAWANPLPFLDRSVIEKLNVLFIRNVPKNISGLHLKQIVESVTREDIQRVKQINDFAFLTFKNHKSAKNALDHLKSIPFVILDQETHVEWAVPKEMITSFPENKWEELGLPRVRPEKSNFNPNLEYEASIPEDVFNIQPCSDFTGNLSDPQERKYNNLYTNGTTGYDLADEETLLYASHLRNLALMREKGLSDLCENKRQDYNNPCGRLNGILPSEITPNDHFTNITRSDLYESKNAALDKSSTEFYTEFLSASLKNNDQEKLKRNGPQLLKFSDEFFGNNINHVSGVADIYPSSRKNSSDSDYCSRDSEDSLVNFGSLEASPMPFSPTNWFSGSASRTLPSN